MPGFLTGALRSYLFGLCIAGKVDIEASPVVDAKIEPIPAESPIANAASIVSPRPVDAGAAAVACAVNYFAAKMLATEITTKALEAGLLSYSRGEGEIDGTSQARLSSFVRTPSLVVLPCPCPNVFDRSCASIS